MEEVKKKYYQEQFNADKKLNMILRENADDYSKIYSDIEYFEIYLLKDTKEKIKKYINRLLIKDMENYVANGGNPDDWEPNKNDIVKKIVKEELEGYERCLK